MAAAFKWLVTISLFLTTVTAQILTTAPGRTTVSHYERQFGSVYEWNVIDFAFLSEQDRADAIYRGEYRPQNNLISDVKPYANRLYLSLPRMLPGVPVS